MRPRAVCRDRKLRIVQGAQSILSLKGVSHRNYVELRSVAYRLRGAYSALRGAYAGHVAIRRGTQKSTRDERKKLNMFSTQFLRKSTQLYATVRHAYAIVRY